MKKLGNVFWGLCFIIAALVLVFSQLGYFGEIEILQVLGGLFVGAILIESLYKKRVTSCCFALAFLLIIFDHELGITAITPWTVLWAAALISIGIAFMRGKNCFSYNGGNWYCGGNSQKNYEIDDDNDEYKYKWKNIETSQESCSSGKMKFETIFGSSKKYIHSQEFEYAKIDCVFGSMQVYFDDAIMANEIGTVMIEAVFSGVEIYVPKGWNIVNKTSAVFGGVNVRESKQYNGEHTLIVKGDVVFGGLDIIYI